MENKKDLIIYILAVILFFYIIVSIISIIKLFNDINELEGNINIIEQENIELQDELHYTNSKYNAYVNYLIENDSKIKEDIFQIEMEIRRGE